MEPVPAVRVVAACPIVERPAVDVDVGDAVRVLGPIGPEEVDELGMVLWRVDLNFDGIPDLGVHMARACDRDGCAQGAFLACGDGSYTAAFYDWVWTMAPGPADTHAFRMLVIVEKAALTDGSDVLVTMLRYWETEGAYEGVRSAWRRGA